MTSGRGKGIAMWIGIVIGFFAGVALVVVLAGLVVAAAASAARDLADGE